jgi:cbb3-type cytochrome oxidase subunit 3
MTENATAAPDRIALDRFLATLPPEAAAELRAEAERIDALERQVMPVRGIERRLKVPFYVSAAMFVIGLVVFLASGRDLETVRALIGEIGLCLLLGALPALAIYYAYRVRWRTRADRAAFEANRDHFMPHGVIYFPAPDKNQTPVVIPVDVAKAYRPKPTKNDKLKPGWIW